MLQKAAVWLMNVGKCMTMSHWLQLHCQGVANNTPPLRGALIFTLFWGFRKFRGALIFFKKFAEILGCVYLHGFWWGALIFTFFLVDFSKDLHCKTPVLQKFSRCAGQISGERLFSHFFEERLLFSLFSFQKILKSAYYFEKILWNDPGAVIKGGLLFAIPW